MCRSRRCPKLQYPTANSAICIHTIIPSVRQLSPTDNPHQHNFGFQKVNLKYKRFCPDQEIRKLFISTNLVSSRTSNHSDPRKKHTILRDYDSTRCSFLAVHLHMGDARRDEVWKYKVRFARDPWGEVKRAETGGMVKESLVSGFATSQANG
jgi:hypothetical protein